jgi:hypothetical protein
MLRGGEKGIRRNPGKLDLRPEYCLGETGLAQLKETVLLGSINYRLVEVMRRDSNSAFEITPLSRSKPARRSRCSLGVPFASIVCASAAVSNPLSTSMRTNGSAMLEALSGFEEAALFDAGDLSVFSSVTGLDPATCRARAGDTGVTNKSITRMRNNRVVGIQTPFGDPAGGNFTGGSGTSASSVSGRL